VREPNGPTCFYLPDGHGSVRLLTDLAGVVTDTYTYDAFGILLEQSGTTTNWFRYAGEYYDPDLGLIHLRQREMNPNTGRFWTADSFEGFQTDPLSLHKYLYAHADPVNRIDPSGHFSGSSVETISVSSIITTLAATLFITGPYISAHISQQEVDTIQSDFEKIQQECQLFQCDEFVVRAAEALKKRRKREPLDWAVIYYKSNSPYHEGHYSLDIYAEQGFGRYGGLRISESGFHFGIILRTRTEVMRELVSDNNVMMVSKPAWITGYLVHHPDPLSFITIKEADRIGVGEIGEIAFSTFLSLYR
jgi:RHS repeat-associated protein